MIFYCHFVSVLFFLSWPRNVCLVISVHCTVLAPEYSWENRQRYNVKTWLLTQSVFRLSVSSLLLSCAITCGSWRQCSIKSLTLVIYIMLRLRYITWSGSRCLPADWSCRWSIGTKRNFKVFAPIAVVWFCHLPSFWTWWCLISPCIFRISLRRVGRCLWIDTGCTQACRYELNICSRWFYTHRCGSSVITLSLLFILVMSVEMPHFETSHIQASPLAPLPHLSRSNLLYFLATYI